MSSRVAVGVVALVAVVTVAAACAGPLASDDADDGTFVTLLGLVADTRDNRQEAYLADWAAASEAAGEDPPEDAEDVLDWAVELNDELDQAFNPVVEWWTEADQAAEVEDELGFHLGQVDASIVAGAPPEQTTALLGRFDPDAVADTVADDPVWSDHLEEVEHDGEEYWSWDDESEPGLEDPSPARPLGRGGNLFVTDDELLWTFSTDVMEASLDARSGDRSLADDDDARAAAEVLDQYGAFVGVLAAPIDADQANIPAYDADVDDALLEPYELLAIGNTTEEDGGMHRGLVVLVNDDDGTAEDNADRLEEILEDGRSAVDGSAYDEAFDLVEVTADGRLTVAVVEFDEAPPGVLVSNVFRQDSLYWHR